MRGVSKTLIGLALLAAFGSADVTAKTRKKPPAQAPAATDQSDDFPIPLPSDLTTNKDWLDDGARPTQSAAKGNLRPNAKANDNYYKQLQGGYDPAWYTQAGSIFDNR